MIVNLTRILLLLSLAVGLQCLAGATPPAHATITLKDKTQLVGEILGLKDGVYTVKSATIGELHVKVQDVARIEYAKPAKATAGTKPAPAPSARPAPAAEASPGLGEADRINALFGFEAILKQVMGDPDLMNKVQKLAEDPEFNKVLDDPEVKKAIENGDFMSLSKNTKIWGLLNHPAVKDIANELKNKPKSEGNAAE